MVYRVQTDSRRRQRVHTDMRVHRMRGPSPIAHELRHNAQPARAAGGNFVALRGMLHQRGAYAVEQPEPDKLLLSVEGLYFSARISASRPLMLMPSSAGTAMSRTVPSSSRIAPLFTSPIAAPYSAPSCTLCPQTCAAPVALSA